MHRLFAASLFALSAASALIVVAAPALAQEAPALEAADTSTDTSGDLFAQLAAFSQAQADEDTGRSADLALALANADLSALPFSAAEVRDLRAALAEALAEAGRFDEAIAVLAAVIAEERAAAQAATEPADRSALTLAVSTRLEALGDLYRAAGQLNDALAAYTDAFAAAQGVYGEDAPETRFVLAKVVETRAAARAAQGLAPEDDPDASLLATLEARAESEALTSLGVGTPLRETETFETVRVFYGTNRVDTGSTAPAKAFTGRRGDELSLGSVVVTVPKDRVPGTIPRPGPLDLRGARDGVHIVLKRIERDADEDAFIDRQRRWREADPEGGDAAFVYIHGHGNGFDDAARRAAQLAVDLDMRHGANLYSWPAGHVLAGYQESQNNVGPSVRHLVSYLEAVSASGADTIHLIAHSMGNRLLLQALEDLKAKGFAADTPGAPFGEIIWASPDVDADVFAVDVGAVADMGRGMTLYASRHDRALQLSQMLGGSYPRAGQAPPPAPVARAVTAIDTSPISRPVSDVVAHGDFASAAINDLRAVVWLSLAPDARCPLALEAPGGDAPYWQAADTRPGCGPEEFRRAVSALRLYGEDAPATVRALLASGQLDPAAAASWRAALGIIEGMAR